MIVPNTNFKYLFDLLHLFSVGKNTIIKRYKAGSQQVTIVLEVRALTALIRFKSAP